MVHTLLDTRGGRPGAEPPRAASAPEAQKEPGSLGKQFRSWDKDSRSLRPDPEGRQAPGPRGQVWNNLSNSWAMP